MAPKICCPNCFYHYRYRSAKSKCPKCGHRLTAEEAVPVMAGLIIAVIIILIVVAAQYGR